MRIIFDVFYFFSLAEIHDPLFSSEYAPDIYTYMKQREVNILVVHYSY